MKIEKDTNKIMTVKDIEVGGCFSWNGCIYLKTDKTTDSELTRWLCVDIEYGEVFHFEFDTVVETVDVKVVIE